MGSEGEEDELLSKALEALLRVPLCDRCLGRLFANLGRGLSNAERGRSIKILLSMVLHSRAKAGDEEARSCILKLAKNACYPFTELARSYSRHENKETGERCAPCAICNNVLDRFISETALIAAQELESLESKSFVVGVKSGSDIELREQNLAMDLGIEHWESVSRELKREVGKRIQLLTGIQPDFKHYDAVVLLDLNSLSVNVQPQPLYILGNYVKLGRFISQMEWVGEGGVKYYELSIEESCRKITRIYNAEELKLHAAGREDADARMLGSGRPLVLELKVPRRRAVNLKVAEVEASTPPWVIIKLSSYVPYRVVQEIKERTSPKVYRVIAYSPLGLTKDDLNTLERKFKDIEIRQRTPRRVLRRRADIERVRRVYAVKGRTLGKYTCEILIHCEGGLYVKELVHGDEGRTSPSFSEVLGKELHVLYLDVLTYCSDKVADNC